MAVMVAEKLAQTLPTLQDDTQWVIDKFEVVHVLILMEYLFMFGTYLEQMKVCSLRSCYRLTMVQ